MMLTKRSRPHKAPRGLEVVPQLGGTCLALSRCLALKRVSTLFRVDARLADACGMVSLCIKTSELAVRISNTSLGHDSIPTLRKSSHF